MQGLLAGAKKDTVERSPEGRRSQKKPGIGAALLKSSLVADINKQTVSVMMGGFTDEENCQHLSKRLFDFYDKDKKFESFNFFLDILRVF